jgi:uncharacterized protein YraI
MVISRAERLPRPMMWSASQCTDSARSLTATLRRDVGQYRAGVGVSGPAMNIASIHHRNQTNKTSGAEGIRTPDPLHAMQVRYQLRHSPKSLYLSKALSP